MLKITFMGAGSTIFARNVLGDCMCSPILQSAEIALYDIDNARLQQSLAILQAINKQQGGKAIIKTFIGIENRKSALRDAKFVVNAIQVGGYDPATIIDFEIPRKYGLRQTIADTLGIGGIMRGLRTIPVVADFCRDMEEVCPNALFLNYANPMAIITGYVQQHTSIHTVGLCHSVQVCTSELFSGLNMEDKLDGHVARIAGINHMAWLLKIVDKDGVDLYPEIKKRAKSKNGSQKHKDMVRFDYIDKLGYYCTESSVHNAEYNPFYIKSRYPQLIEKFNIPLDEYPRRCIKLLAEWSEEFEALTSKDVLTHERSHEYASHIMEAVVTNTPYSIGGNVLNTGGLIANLPREACVEVPCLVDGNGITPCYVGNLPEQLAAMNRTNINPQLLTIKAAHTLKKEHIYQAAMLDPLTSSELSVDDIVSMVDELLEAHGNMLPKYN